MDLSLIYALLLKYWKKLSYPKFTPTSTHAISPIHFNQHIVLVTALNRHFCKFSIIYFILLTKATCLLALLDFSSAFSTIDHFVIVHRLHADFGFTETVLRWFSSYLTDRTQYVSLSNQFSAFAPVHSGVPQGSVLAPILFSMHTKPLSAIIDLHSIIHHSSADDLQPLMSATPDKIS